MSDSLPELLQFRHSHFNEKARWALDWKCVPHTRRSLLPGPHIRTIQSLTGQTSVPVLLMDGNVIQGSARILEELEQRVPEPPLYPKDPAARARALEIQSWFDDEVAPCVRRSFFATALHEPTYVCGMFASDRNLATRALYRAVFPVVMGRMKRSMGITDRSIEEADAMIERGLDFVVRERGPSGHLVGEAFTVADLTAASILAPVADPPGSSMERPRPLPQGVERWLARWADHSGVAWVREQYRKHRPPSAEA